MRLFWRVFSVVFRPSWIYRVSNLIRKCRMYLWGSKKTLYVVLGLGEKFFTSFMRPTLKVSRLDPEFIHSRKSNEGEKFTTKWPVNFKRFTRMIKIGGLNLPIGKNVLRFIRRGRKKCPKIAVKSPKIKKSVIWIFAPKILKYPNMSLFLHDFPIL